ncbi:MAG TPA: hypothetical protein VIF82_17170 [Burkholderiaceae bacterium]|jgi:hypothetical protein
MNMSNLSALGLQARLALMRLGWINNIACMLIVFGIAAWLWGIPYLRMQTNAPMHALEQAQKSLASTNSHSVEAAHSLPEERLAAFYDVLGDQRYVEQQVKTLFAVAAKSGLILNQGEYKSSLEKGSHSTTYQMILPVKGQYQAIRKFCEQTLLAIPFASLDEISFKRDEITNNTLEAKLHFTLYLSDSTASGSAASAKESRP